MAIREEWEEPAPSAPTYSFSLKKALTNTVRMAEDVLDKTGVCALTNSETGKAATQVSTAVPNPYGAIVQVVGKLCDKGPSPILVVPYPVGSVGVFDTALGKFKIAAPPTTGQDLFIQIGLESVLPSGVTQVSSDQYEKLTKYWYSRKSFMIGAGVAAISLVGLGSYLIIKR